MAYAVLVVCALLFELAMNLPVGAMPLALTADGESRPAVAAVMGSGLVAAMAVSLPVGAFVDRAGRLLTIRLAGALGTLAVLGLCFAHGALGGSLLLALRGAALVGYMTAEFAYASELAPATRAVSGVATLGMIGNFAFAFAPAIGVFAWQHGVGRAQFAYAAAFAALGTLGLFALPARYDVRGTPRPPLFLEPRWLPPIGFLLAGTMQGGVNGSLAVLTFHDRGIVNGAAIFTASALTTFALRYGAGRLVDRFGPRAIAAPTALVQALGCVLAAWAHSLLAVIVAGVCLGTAWAAVVPVALGLLFEESDSRTRGAAMGAYNIAFSGGAALGALIATAATFAGPGYPLAMIVCACTPLAALPYILQRVRRSN